MSLSRITALLMACALLLAGTAIAQTQSGSSGPSDPSQAAEQSSRQALVKAAAKGYVFGYPLVMMDVTRDQYLAKGVSMNQLNHTRHFPDADFRRVVSVNVDTLYSTAWLDLSQAMVFCVPATERYYVMQFMGAWTNVFASVGPRTTGRDAGCFLLVGPDWQGEAPADMKVLRSPTRLAWMIGRIESSRDKADLAAAHAIQNHLRLIPLKAWQQGKRSAADEPKHSDKQLDKNNNESKEAGNESTVALVRAMDAKTFFTRLAKLMVDNPPAERDQAAMANLAVLGVAPGQPPEWNEMQRKAVQRGIKLAEQRLTKAEHAQRDLHQGWSASLSLGRYGTNYGFRALIARIMLGVNLPEDAVYPIAYHDSQGRLLTGEHRYRLHFEAGKLPPAQAFWSITAYNANNFLVDNPIDRYSISDKDDLVYGDDGSLTIYLQAHPPENAPKSNWLPIPEEGPFNIIARIYWPKEAVLEGRWHMPGIKRVD